MPTVSTIFFVLCPTPLDDTDVAIVVELYREDKLEVSTTLATCPPEQLDDMLAKFRTHLQGLGMKDRHASPTPADAVSSSEQPT